MQKHKQVELSNMEEMDDGLNLVFSHVRAQNKAFKLEPVKEYFYSIGLSNIIDKNKHLSCGNR